MSGLPAIAVAEDNSGEVGVQTQVRVQTQGSEASSSVRVGEEEQSSGDQQKQEVKGQENQFEATSSGRIGDEEGNSQEIDLELEDDSDVAFSLDDLNKKIEVRKVQLAQEVASTTEADKNIVENANQVRLAVRALLASKDLIGGIGPKVSEIAKQMNGSVTTTTNAEAKIQSRSFLARLFFGGDRVSADVISQEVAQNQQRIDDLTSLLGGANVSADIQIVLKAQITALQTAQVRLQDLAQKEQKMWGLFSWRC